MQNDQKLVYYSLLSGEIYEIDADEVENMDQFQIPLTQRPKQCKKCFNRGYIGYDSTLKYYPMCKCVLKCIDHSRIKDVKINY